MVLYTTNTAKKTIVALHNARDKTIHVLGIIYIDGHASVFRIDDDVVQRYDFTHDQSILVTHKGRE